MEFNLVLLLSFGTGFFGNNHRAFGRMLSSTSGKRKRVSCTQRHQLNCFDEYIKYSDKKSVVIDLKGLFEHATACVAEQNIANDKYVTDNSPQVMRLVKFEEFTEFNKSSALFRKKIQYLQNRPR